MRSVSERNLPFFNAKFKYKTHYSKDDRVFFGIVTPNNFINRQTWIKNSWLDKVIAEGYHSGKFLCNSSGQFSDLYYPPDKILYNYSKRTDDKDVDRAVRRVAGAMYFLENTNCEWYWSIGDDVNVDIESLEAYLNEMTIGHDPRKEVIIKGHCISIIMTTHLGNYLQGGVGYLFSRKAAEKFVELGPEWISRVDFLDDMYLSWIFQRLKMETEEFRSDRFLGDRFDKTIFAKVLNKERDFDPCHDSVPPHGGCQYSGMTHISKIIGIHDGDLARNSINWEAFQKLKSDPSIFLYASHDSGWNICRKNFTNELRKNQITVSKHI